MQRTVIITGAAGGVGRVVTKAWIESGAQVLAVDANARGEEALRQFVGPSERLVPFVADLSTAEGAAGMVARAKEVFSTPDTLVHLVGGFAMGSIMAEDAQATWDQMFLLNLQTSFHCFRAMVPAFRRIGGGWIVAMSSKVVSAPAAQVGAYAASKSAMAARARAMSDELKGENIRVNLIQAATIDTPANRAAMGEEAARLWVRPEDVAAASLYLCSPQAQSIHGASLELFGLQ